MRPPRKTTRTPRRVWAVRFLITLGMLLAVPLFAATALAYGVANPYDPAQNIRAGVAYLKSLMERYQQKEELALAAYNAGPGAVEKYHNAVPPYRETRAYVARVVRDYNRKKLAERNQQAKARTQATTGKTTVAQNTSHATATTE